MGSNNLILPLERVSEPMKSLVGGKAYSLSRLRRMGFNVPRTFCVTTAAYEAFIQCTGLRERILLELNRKPFEEMRWEEIWDAALRIRNLFLVQPFPPSLQKVLEEHIGPFIEKISAAVRSSAPEEDDASSSFAGLHESFIHVQGVENVLDCIRKVWASLWSDTALLYRQELKLTVEKSAMAVIVQEVIDGKSSGVAFSKNPNDEYKAVIESVHGLNLGLVDGAVEPDRWIFDRSSKKMLHHTQPIRDKIAVFNGHEIELKNLPRDRAKKSPLSPTDTRRVLNAVLALESVLGVPQDVEWTLKGKILYLLQARPITTIPVSDASDQRPWYRSLHRSFENLNALRLKIEKEYLPEMQQEAKRLASEDLDALSDSDLADAIEHRSARNDHWVSVYWREFIPFAHGMRLFGQVYNDSVHPENPYEFMDLLGATPMISLKRNRMLENLSAAIRENRPLRHDLIGRKNTSRARAYFERIHEFIEKFGDLSCPVTGGTQCGQGEDALIKILLELADHPPLKPKSQDPKRIASLKEAYLNPFPPRRKSWAKGLLDLARASYRLRDDDNIYLGQIEAQLLRGIQTGRERLTKKGKELPESIDAVMIIESLRGTPLKSGPPSEGPLLEKEEHRLLKVRQLTGQPAGPGISRGKARVIETPDGLSDFKFGEILVCDAVDPNITFVVPLAAGIVERRGGMLIHGAIIAREYGLPCVTGVPEATHLIRTGDDLTVDGFLGIITVDSNRT